MNRQVEYFRWGTTETVDELGAAIAETLGMNYDDENKILYCGEDKNNGFQIGTTGSGSSANANITFKSWCNGAAIGNNYWTVGGNNGRVFAYAVNDDGTAAVFGPSSTEIRAGYSKTINANGETDYVYFQVPGVGNAFTGVFGQNQNFSSFGNSTIAITHNTRVLVLAPITLIDENTAIATDLYFKIAGDRAEYNTSKFVSLNGEDYMIIMNGNSGWTQPVIHLGKS